MSVHWKTLSISETQIFVTGLLKTFMLCEALRQEFNMQLVVPTILLAQKFYIFESHSGSLIF